MGNEILYEIVAITEAIKNADGTYTTEQIFNAKYPGGTNQVQVCSVLVAGKEYKIITKML